MTDAANRFDLTGKVALVTGASEGIGRHLSLGLARAGASVAVASRREELLRETAALVEAEGGRALVAPMDVTNLASIEQCMAATLATFGRLDVLVNNAGAAANTPALDSTESEWDLQVDVGFKGVFFCAQAAARAMLKAETPGSIINIGSTFSRSAFPGRAIYCAVKAGVDHLTHCLAVEWGRQGIRVNTLSPASTLTPSRAELFSQQPVMDRILSRIPLGRITAPTDLINAAIFLASDASAFVTGTTLFVDGGWTANS